MNNDISQKWSYDTLSTPINDQDFKILIERVQKDIYKWIDSKNWLVLSRTNNVILEEESVNNSDISAIKGTIILNMKNTSLNEFVDKLFSPLLKDKKKTYKDITMNKCVYIIDNDNIIVHSKFKTLTGPAGLQPVSPREAVVLSSRKVLDDGSYLVTSQSINYKEIPFSKDHIRCIVKSGILITQLEDKKIKVVKAEHLEPKGWIPSIIINMLKDKSIKRLNNLKVYLS
jgi:hypothetical protein